MSIRYHPAMIQLAKTLFAFSLITFIAQGTHAQTIIHGAGATFPYPLYSKWISDFQKIDPQVQINYQSIGSGAGIRQFLEKTVDFGATDTPMTDEQLAKSKVQVAHLPMALGAVVLTYKIPGINSAVTLSGEVVADLFLGKIKKWNDPKISALNPSLKFPDQAVTIVHRSDGSGTTGIFTDYLSKVSPEWKEDVGSGTAVSWPTGLGGKGNEGVAGLIQQTPGSIGYLELIYAKKNKLGYASIKNSAGAIVEANAKSVSAAAGSVKPMPADFRVSITQAPGKDAYPIAGFTYILLYDTFAADFNKAKAQKIMRFLEWAVQDGQKSAESLDYAPLPKAVAAQALAKIQQIRKSI